MGAACDHCDGEAEADFAIVDWEDEAGPFCLSCALAFLANANQHDDATALRLVRVGEPERAWVALGGRARHRPDNPPSWVRDEDTWERAKEAVAPHWDSYRAPWAVVVDVYRAMGGRHR